MHRVWRLSAWTCLAVLAFTESAHAQWAERLFDTLSHDFGTVARGQHVKKRFKITNTLSRPLHIASAVPSCRICSVAKLDRQWLQPGESVMLETGMQTIGFTGPRSVSVTVTFDRPSYGRARLTLQCYSRSDVVLSPGELVLGTVKQGKPITRKMKIEYAGRPDWKIAAATCANRAIDVALEETHRGPTAGGGHHEIGYLMTVSLKPEAPVGRIFDRIMLEVNDAYNKSLDVVVRGTVQSQVTLLPTAFLSFGTVSLTNPSSKRVLVGRSSEPFKIVSIEEGQPGPFQINRPVLAKQLHTLKVTLKPDGRPGKVKQNFTIKTDLEGQRPLKLTVSATLVQ